MDSVRRRNCYQLDEPLDVLVTIRRYYEDGEFVGADVYYGGWRQNRRPYKTERGAERAAQRLIEGAVK